MILSKQTRIEKIKEIVKRDKENPFGKLEIPWEDGLRSMEVYKIPLDYLIYNKYNGRILSRTKSLESQDKKIDVETPEGKGKIEDLLWLSKVDRNEQTLHSIKTAGGQQKPGIITRDGIIIDGNRRAMLLSRSGMYDYFKAVVLPVTLEENPLEIEKLETTYQMGEDEKLGYNPIEKYLKAKGLYKTIAKREYSSTDASPDQEAVRKISEWMGEDKSTIKDYLQIMETMDDYLDYLEYNGIYTQLDGREDQFINLTRWLTTFYGEDSAKAFDGYRDEDVDDLRTIAYDYIRIKYEGKKFRNLAYGLKENHYFGDREIWSSFRDFHFDQKDKIIEEEINLNSPNLERHLNDRDKAFLELSKLGKDKSFLHENDDNHYTWLRNKKAADEPEKLVKNAIRSLESINQNHKSFSSPSVKTELKSLNEFASKMLKRSSLLKLLAHVESLLEEIDVSKSNDDKNKLMEKAKSIQRIIYQLTKDIKKS
ncbi:MAG: hypothetical protein RLN88_10515 [Ekhidna sp.]|uniref:hypothetical protein n=1 Tax=Ekhidna sp. TaxID=2608089 RepID=UPI0032EC9A3F